MAREPESSSAKRAKRGAVVVTALLVAAAVPAAGAVAAPKPSISDLEKQVRKLNDKAEQVTEAYNGGRVKLKRAQSDKRSADRKLRSINRQLAGLKRKVGATAAQQYMNGGADSGVSSIVGEGPQQVIDRSTIMTHLDRNQAALLSNLTTTQKRAAKASSDSRKAASSAKRTADRLGGQKSDAEKAVSKARTKLNTLRREAAAQNRPDPTQPTGGDSAPPPPAPSSSSGGGGKAAEAVKAAESQMGKPYVWGADGPDSFDCSGLTMWAYQQVGISIPHYTVDQYNAAKSHPSMSEAKPGDLIFFGSDMHHVGMYVGSGKFVEAPFTGANVRISAVSSRSDISGLGRYA